MIKMYGIKAVWACMATLFVCCFLASGCANQKIRQKSASTQITQMAKFQKTKQNAPVYHDFKDVLIPKELKIDQKLSFVFQTLGSTAGVLVLKGRVEINSLIAFFDVNMTKDNWKLVSSFKSPRSLMLFQKDNKWCIISVSEKDFSNNTYVEIWVAPTQEQENIPELPPVREIDESSLLK